MENDNLFIKKLENYLDLTLNDFDKERIAGYLREYVADIPELKPQVITKIKTVYKYLGEDLKEKMEVDATMVLVKPSEIIEFISGFIVQPQEIIELISQKTGVSITKMKGRQRYSDYVLARHTAMFFINKSCFESLLATGKIFNRDHTSVIHAIRNVRNMIEGGHTKYIELVQSISDTIKQNNIPLTTITP